MEVRMTVILRVVGAATGLLLLGAWHDSRQGARGHTEAMARSGAAQSRCRTLRATSREITMATYSTPATCSRITIDRAWSPVGRMSERPTLVRFVKEKNNRSKNRLVPSPIGPIDPGTRITTAR